MGSNGDVIPQVNGEEDGEGEEITVMVTGFAPFRPQNPKNPAWEITRLLPPFLLPRVTPVTDGRPAPSTTPKVRILIYPEPIKVAYKSVRELVPKLWAYSAGEPGAAQDAGQYETGKQKRVDFMIHIGMASGRRYYSIERRGHREGYVMKDVDGKILEDDGGTMHKPKQEVAGTEDSGSNVDTASKGEPVSAKHPGGCGVLETGFRRPVIKPSDELEQKSKSSEDTLDVKSSKDHEQEMDPKADTPANGPSHNDNPDAVEVGALHKPWIWEGLPTEILTDIDIDDVWKRWRIGLPGLDLRISEDAGRYLCDFIYYSSLAELTKREEEKRVLFLHVPVESDEENVAKGVEITCELIRGIVESARVKRKVGQSAYEGVEFVGGE